MPPPVPPLRFPELHLELSRRLSLHAHDQLRRRETWRDRHEQMDVILRDVLLHDLNLVGRADLTDELPQPDRLIAHHDAVPVLGDPDQVVLHVEDRVGPFR